MSSRSPGPDSWLRRARRRQRFLHQGGPHALLLSPSEVIDLATATPVDLAFIAKMKRCATVFELQVNEPARKKPQVFARIGR